MKKKQDIKSIKTALSVIGLVLLLLLSPCKVRHFIQTELGVPQTQVLNKSQTSLSQSNCNSTVNSSIVLSHQKTETHRTQSAFAVFSKPEFVFAFFDFPQHFSFSYASKIYAASPIPLYILFHSFKYHI